jgi:hypothetical protein
MKTSGKCGPIIEKEGETKRKSDIDPSKFKISNLQINTNISKGS